MRVLFVEPFYGGSHAAFLDGLVRHSAHEIVPLTLAGGEWRARMRRGAQELALAAKALDGTFDLIACSDMLDLPTFLALTRPHFERTPVIVYFHENQFTYPRIRGTKLNSWFGAMNYLSARAADRVFFNSAFHRVDFLGALRTLSAEPTNWLVADAIDEIEAKSGVLPVGVELGELLSAARPERETGPPQILWNHRWEFDKAPDVFARAMLALAAEGFDFRLALAGDPGPNPHPAMAELRHALPDRVLQFGKIEREADYHRLLLGSNIVVSTTRHEFFGVGIVEALAAGCFPVLPARFTYPDFVPEELHDRSLWEDEDELRALLRAALRTPSTPAERGILRVSASRFDWSVVAPQWDAVIEVMAGHAP